MTTKDFKEIIRRSVEKRKQVGRQLTAEEAQKIIEEVLNGKGVHIVNVPLCHTPWNN